MVNPRYRELKPLAAANDHPFIIVREGKKPVVERCPCFKHPQGERMGEYQGGFTVTGVNLPEDGKKSVGILAGECIEEMEKASGCKLHIAIYEDTISGNQRTWRCYAYSLDRENVFRAHKDAKIA